MVKGDSKCTNDLIQKQDVVHHVGYSLINSIKKVLAEIDDTAVDHIFREANSCVDALSRQGEFHETGIGFFESPCSFLIPHILADVSGTNFSRVLKFLSPIFTKPIPLRGKVA
ncbi:hypothetical protein AHAS_Ahas09G0197400 [Arachis hypogaea]